MALVAVTNVEVLNNPAPFTAPFSFEITFECIAELSDDIEWKIIYVGSAESEEHDQVLDSILVGPVPVGLNKFVFEANAPNWQQLPPSEIIGVTVVLITCSYRRQEFVRIGYYVNNDFMDPEVKENPPTDASVEEVVHMLGRAILHDKPRVTRYTIDWEDSVKENVLPAGGGEAWEAAAAAKSFDAAPGAAGAGEFGGGGGGVMVGMGPEEEMDAMEDGGASGGMAVEQHGMAMVV